MRQEFPDLARHYWRANRLWSGSYFAGSVGGAPLSVLHQYIDQQKRPVQSTLRPQGGLPTRPFTPVLKAGALARISVARFYPVRRRRPVHHLPDGGGGGV